jgi:transcription termination factor Rho
VSATIKQSGAAADSVTNVGRADSTVMRSAGRVLGAAAPKAAENQLVEFLVAHSDGL